MAIATKGKRKISVLGREFVWHANNEWKLHIASVDKCFVVSLPIVFPPFAPHNSIPDECVPLLVSGPEFPGLENEKDVWIKCNAISKSEIGSTPGIVRKIIEWCFAEKQEIEILGPLKKA